jgi:hypothetical protein
VPQGLWDCGLAFPGGDTFKQMRHLAAIPVFAGLILKYGPTEGEPVPKCGGGYYAQFICFKAI